MALITITKDNFNEEVAQSNVPVLLDFWASWCGPCKMLSPIIDEIAQENDNIKVGKINVDEQPELAQFFNIASIPTLAVINGGKTVNSHIGYCSKADVLKLLEF